MARGRSNNRSGTGVARGATRTRAARIEHTEELLAAAGLSIEWLRTDLESEQVLAGDKVDPMTLAHNALMAWMPGAYPGHPGHRREAERVRDDLAITLALDGDHKAEHTYFYQDAEFDGYWNLGAAQAASGYYRLPRDASGGIVAEGLAARVSSLALVPPEATFIAALRREPANTLGIGDDLPRPERDATALGARAAADLSDEAAAAIVPEIVGTDEERRARLVGALALAADAGVEGPERDALALCAWFGPRHLGGSARALPGGISPATAALAERLMEETTPVPSEEGLPVLVPASPLGRMAADAAQAWMEGPGCDRIADGHRRASGMADTAEWVDAIRQTAARTPWHSPAGRARYQKAVRRHEARLRGILALATDTEPDKAPTRRLKPAE